MRTFLLALVLAVWMFAPARAQSTAPLASPAPLQIFTDAFRKLQSYPVPPYAIFTTVRLIYRVPFLQSDDADTQSIGSQSETVTKNTTRSLPPPVPANSPGRQSAPVEQLLRYAWRASDGMENGTPTDKYPALPPAFIGTQFVGPFAWALRSSTHVAPESNGTSMQPDIDSGLKAIASDSGLKTIAVVTAHTTANYEITLAGIETIDGHRTYHLRLRPANDPQVHNLRDLWIDSQTSDLWRAHYTGAYYGTPCDIVVNFAPGAGGYWLVARETWTLTGSDGHYTFDSQTTKMVLPPALPDWLFDEDVYAQHQKAGEPDFIGNLLDRTP